MSMLSKLRERLQSRQVEGVESYWHTVSAIARGTLSESATDAAIERLEPLLATLRKKVDDVDADAAAFAEFVSFGDTAAQTEEANSKSRELRNETVRLQKLADTAHAELQRLTQELENTRNRANGMQSVARDAAGGSNMARRKLLERGCPEALIAAVFK